MYTKNDVIQGATTYSNNYKLNTTLSIMLRCQSALMLSVTNKLNILSVVILSGAVLQGAG
jgi:hypothetical protein